MRQDQLSVVDFWFSDMESLLAGERGGRAGKAKNNARMKQKIIQIGVLIQAMPKAMK